MSHRVNLRTTLAITAASLSALAGGCDDRSSDADKAIHAQAREVYGMSVDSPAGAVQAIETQVMQRVATELAPHLASDVTSEKAAAAALVAQSNLNLAEIAMLDVSNAESVAAAKIAEIDAQLGHWRRHQAMKAAAESFDPSEQLAEIARAKAEKDKAIAAARRNKADLEAQLNELRAKAKEKMDAVAEREAQYGELMGQAARLSATEGVPIVEQANGIKREADLLRMAGTKLEAQAGVIEPQVREADALVNQLINQKQDMEATEAALAKAISDARAEAAAAGASANEAAVRIAALATEVASAREAVLAAYDKADGLYRKAIQNAREASKDSAAAGKAMVGNATLASAYMKWQKSQGLRLYASMLESLAKVEPPLSQRASYASKAEEVRQAAKDAANAAVEDMEAAKTAFEGVRVQGAVKERLETLSELIGTAMNVSKDDSTNTSPELLGLAGMNAPAAVMSESSSSSGSRAAAPASGNPRATVEALIATVRSDDAAAQLNLLALPNDVRRTLAPLAAAQSRLDKACRSKLGKSFSELARSMPGMEGMAGSSSDLEALRSAGGDIEIEENGDTATATIAGVSRPLTLKRIDGRWLVHIPEIDQMAEQMQMMGPMLTAIAKAMDQVAAEVEAGQHTTAQAILSALQQKMMGGG
jgi:hypothetical protein